MDHTRALLHEVFEHDVHAARIRSLANGVIGVLNASMVSVTAVGRAYAAMAKISTKSGVKQVDRLLSNDGIVLDEVIPLWIRYVVGDLDRITVALDWTDFDDDDHTTLCASLITTHGRATPLAWRTHQKSKLKDRRTEHELGLVRDLRRWIPDSTRVELLADRAFGYQQMYALLDELGWDYTIRFRENILVFEHDDDKTGLRASACVPQNGRASKLVAARVTAERAFVPALVFVKRKGMKEAWCLASSRADEDASKIVRSYSRRFTIEETFRDTKDITLSLPRFLGQLSYATFRVVSARASFSAGVM